MTIFIPTVQKLCREGYDYDIVMQCIEKVICYCDVWKTKELEAAVRSELEKIVA